MGSTPTGEFFVSPLTDTFCGAAGARAFRDGVDLGGEIPNVVSRWANAESQELNTPLALSLPARGARTRAGPASTAAACVTSTPSRRTGRPVADRTHAVRQGHARADEPRPLRRLPGLQRRLLHVPAGERRRLAGQPRRDERRRADRPVLGVGRPRARAISSTSASWAAAATATPSTATPKPCERTSSSDSSARRRHRTSTASSSPTAESTLRRRRPDGERSGPSASGNPSRRRGASTFRRAGFGSRNVSSERPAARRSARSAAASSHLRMRGGKSTPIVRGVTVAHAGPLRADPASSSCVEACCPGCGRSSTSISRSATTRRSRSRDRLARMAAVFDWTAPDRPQSRHVLPRQQP